MPGLNVISGPSDTGKSYILECIDYMFGGTTPPRWIPEADAYETVELGIATWRGEPYTLTRSLSGGGCRLRDGAAEETTLSASASAKTSLSKFLLNLADFADKTLRAVKSGGKTQRLGFRYLAHLVVIDEDNIYKTGSPFLSGQFTAATPELALLKLLLTGKDDSHLLTGDGPTAALELKRKANAGLLRELYEAAERALSASAFDTDDAIQRELEELEREERQLAADLEARREELRDLETSRGEKWGALKERESRAILVDELLNRFDLLRAYYLTDEERLDSIVEAGRYMSELGGTDCPLCGAPPQHQQSGSVALADLEAATRRERQRLSVLLADLKDTTETLQRERALIGSESEILRREILVLKQKITGQLRPSESLRQGEFAQLFERRKRLERSTVLLSSLTDLEQRLVQATDATAMVAPEEPSGAELTAPMPLLDELAQEMGSLLDSWGYPHQGRAIYGEKKQDFVVGGRDRGGTGKGLRAITHSAFTIGLMRYCRHRDLPHPGVVVLDSPLLAYREADTATDEEVPVSLKEEFYRSLAKLNEPVQIVILEHEDPPVDMKGELQSVRFSGSHTVGRYGFFPALEPAERAALLKRHEREIEEGKPTKKAKKKKAKKKKAKKKAKKKKKKKKKG